MTENTACLPCQGLEGPLPENEIQQKHAELNEWEIIESAAHSGGKSQKALKRRFTFKGFAKAVEMANLAAWLGNKMKHHPDVKFGWGYCEVIFTSHEAGGITQNDFTCAHRLNELMEE